MFSQLLTVHAKVAEDFAVPVIFAFLPNKMKDTYKKVFNQMKKLVPRLNTEETFLKTFCCDFERGLMEAARIEFDPMNRSLKIGKITRVSLKSREKRRERSEGRL